MSSTKNQAVGTSNGNTKGTGAARHGFTLVELLVVIGIIAVLVSILLPSLNRARENAKRVACASLMRQIGVAARSYANDNKDSLPPYRFDNGAANYNLSSTYVYTYTMGFGDTPDSGALIGRLVQARYMKGDVALFSRCPSGDVTDARADLNSYHFNPWMCFRTDPGATLPAATYYLQPWWKKMSKVGKLPAGQVYAKNVGTGVDAANYTLDPRKRCLAIDPLNSNTGANQNFRYATHFIKGQRAYNLLYADGSVATGVLGEKVIRNDVNSWGRLLDAIGMAETAADGRDMGGNSSFGAKFNSIYNTVPVNP